MSSSPSRYAAHRSSNPSEYSNQISLSKFLFTEEIKNLTLTNDFTEIVNTFQIVAKAVSALLQRVGLTNPFDLKWDKARETSGNILTTASNMFFHLLSNVHSVAVLVSGSEKGPIEVHQAPNGKFIVVYNPLEALANVDLGLNTGSIFGIMVKSDMTLPKIPDVTNQNTVIVAAGYILYGSSTIFVLSTTLGVNEFVLDPHQGEFILTHPNLKIPDKGYVYSVNEGYMSLWEDSIKEYVREKKFPDKKKAYFARYVGSMVADVHRTLKHGGIFLYPANKNSPQGKLKLLCECKPMAFIASQAGGAASNGTVPILDVEVSEVFQKTPFFLGTVTEVTELLEFVENHKLRVNI